MITPLDVPTVVAAHLVQDDVGSWTSIVDIAQNMELVDSQALDDVGYSDDEIIGSACADNRINNNIDIGCLVMIFGVLVQKLLDNIREIAWQRFSHLASGIFAGNITAYSHQLVQGDVIPVVNVGFVLLDEFQFLLRIVNKRAEFSLLLFAKGIAKEFVHLTLDIS